jgi:uncharacterized protein
MDELASKVAALRAIVGELPGAIVAFSGGVDSSLLAAVAAELLGDRALAVTGVSPSLAPSERAEARAVAGRIGIRHREIETQEFARPAYVENSPQRCFECKDELFGLLAALASEDRPAGLGDAVVLDGANADDAGDFRPGRRAAAAHGVRSPLAEAGLAKSEVRALARQLALPTWDKPAMACLASRVPYGSPVTPEKLAQIAAAEAALRALGFRELRVRHHDQVARVELAAAELPRAFAEPTRGELVAAVKQAGFAYVTVDLEGFRSGAMNEVLSLAVVGAPAGGR